MGASGMAWFQELRRDPVPPPPKAPLMGPDWAHVNPLAVGVDYKGGDPRNAAEICLKGIPRRGQSVRADPMVRTFGPAVPLDTPQASTPAPEPTPKLPSEPQSNTTIILPRSRP